MVRKILVTELILIALLGLYFFPLVSLPYIGTVMHPLLWGVLLFVIVLYLPGYWWSWVFFSKNELSYFERFITSFALSLGFVVFVSLYIAIAGIEVTTWHGVVTSCIAIITGIVIVGLLQNRHST